MVASKVKVGCKQRSCLVWVAAAQHSQHADNHGCTHCCNYFTHALLQSEAHPRVCLPVVVDEIRVRQTDQGLTELVCLLLSMLAGALGSNNGVCTASNSHNSMELHVA